MFILSPHQWPSGTPPRPLQTCRAADFHYAEDEVVISKAIEEEDHCMLKRVPYARIEQIPIMYLAGEPADTDSCCER